MRREQPISIPWLQLIAEGKLPVNGPNVWKVLQYPQYVQALGKDGAVLEKITLTTQCASFRITRRGKELLEEVDKPKAKLIFDKNDLPIPVSLCVSALRRFARNLEKGLHVTYSDGKLHLLAEDTTGKVKDDAAHRIASVKISWHEK